MRPLLALVAFAADLPPRVQQRVDVDELRGEPFGYTVILPADSPGSLPVLFMPQHPTGIDPALIRLPEVGGPWAVVLVDGWNLLYGSRSTRAYNRLVGRARVRAELRALQAAALRDALVRYGLDGDRVVCLGTSASGNACWDLAMHWPGVFAGVWPVSAGYHPAPDSACLDNLRGQHLYVLHGLDDPLIADAWVEEATTVARAAGAEVQVVSVVGAAHGVFADEVWEAGLAWAAAQRRVEAPSPVACDEP